MRRPTRAARLPRAARTCATSLPTSASTWRRALRPRRSRRSCDRSSRWTRAASPPPSRPRGSLRCRKPILPIDGRPVIATLVRDLAAARCEDVTVVTGHLAEHVEQLLGDGSAFGARIRYVRQPRPDGSADAVRCALAGGAQAPTLVTG